MECVVQGVIETQHVAALEVLLLGLCGGNKEAIKVHEIRLKSGPNLGTVPSDLQVLCDLSRSEPVWTARHLGGTLRGAGAEQLPALVRNVLEANMSSNALKFLYMLGYKLDYEFLRTGFAFRYMRGVPISVSVTSICKIPKLHSLSEAVVVTQGLHLVEVAAPSSTDNYNEVVTAMSTFAEFVAPLVHLSKPGISMGVVPTAAIAAATLMSKEALKGL